MRNKKNAGMRILPATIMLFVISLFSTVANAATVTIDFESLPDQTGIECGPVCTSDPAQWTEHGFVLAASDTVDNGSFPGGVIAPGTGFAPSPASFGDRSLLFCGTCGQATFVLTQQEGQAFDLHSFDQTAAFPGGGDVWTIIGNYAAGGTVSTNFITSGLRTATFGSEWAGLESVTIIANTDGALDYRLDNIVVSAVPVPAAVWLFGSALAGLGWMRRRKTD